MNLVKKVAFEIAYTLEVFSATESNTVLSIIAGELI